MYTVSVAPLLLRAIIDYVCVCVYESACFYFNRCAKQRPPSLSHAPIDSRKRPHFTITTTATMTTLNYVIDNDVNPATPTPLLLLPLICTSVNQVTRGRIEEKILVSAKQRPNPAGTVPPTFAFLTVRRHTLIPTIATNITFNLSSPLGDK